MPYTYRFTSISLYLNNTCLQSDCSGKPQPRFEGWRIPQWTVLFLSTIGKEMTPTTGEEEMKMRDGRNTDSEPIRSIWPCKSGDTFLQQSWKILNYTYRIKRQNIKDPYKWQIKSDEPNSCNTNNKEHPIDMEVQNSEREHLSWKRFTRKWSG